METGTRGGMLTTDFLTQSYRISAQVAVRNRRLINILSDTYRSLVELYDVYVSRITQPGDIVATNPTAAINKNSIICAVLPIIAGVVPQDRSYISAKPSYSVFITAASFEIQGQLMSASRLDLNTFLSADAERFMPIMKARAVVSSHPQISFSGAVILLNKNWIDLFCAREPD
jgi:hypothetical protein